MKKRNVIFGLLLITIVLSSFGVGETYARYITTDSGVGQATAAKWNAVITGFAGSGTSKTIALAPVSNEYVASGVIAPDSDAVGILDIDLTGTQVAVDLDATLGSVKIGSSDVPANHFTVTLAIYDASTTDANITNGSASPIATINSGTSYLIPLSSDTLQYPHVKIGVKLHWMHNGDSTSGEESTTLNSEDTTIGSAADGSRTISATINVTAKQHLAES